jgi:glycosyltransferase involved in cell wall biosynthesis
MKILLFVRSLEVGGSQRQLAALAAGLANRGHDVAVAVFYKNGPNEEALAGSGARLLDLGKASRWDIFGPFLRLWRFIRAERFDILYAFLPTQTTLSALLIPSGSRLRLVFGVRAAGMQAAHYDALSALMYRLEVWLSRRANLIIANAEAGRTDAIVRGMRADRIVVVPNGIDTVRISPDRGLGRAFRQKWGVPDGSFIIGMVARLDPMKDHETFLYAAAEFARLDPEARFVCVGDGTDEYRARLKALAQLLNIDKYVVWAGQLNDARMVHNAFDIATLSSSFGEAFPNSIGESMACGVPVVATNIGDVAVIVGDCGEVVPPRRPDLLCAGWVKMQRRMKDKPDVGMGGRTRVIEKYNVDAMIGRTEKLLANISADQ